MNSECWGQHILIGQSERGIADSYVQRPFKYYSNGGSSTRLLFFHDTSNRYADMTPKPCRLPHGVVVSENITYTNYVVGGASVCRFSQPSSAAIILEIARVRSNTSTRDGHVSLQYLTSPHFS
jgi:hypothetical protein